MYDNEKEDLNSTSKIFFNTCLNKVFLRESILNLRLKYQLHL